jgi:hypothetical protein
MGKREVDLLVDTLVARGVRRRYGARGEPATMNDFRSLARCAVEYSLFRSHRRLQTGRLYD